MITQKRKAGTEACSECCIDLRRINTHGNELTVIDRQLFLKLSQKAQLHLALGSPVSTVENNNQRILSGNIRKLNFLAVVIRHFYVRKLFANLLIHHILSTIGSQNLLGCQKRKIPLRPFEKPESGYFI